MAHHQLIDSLTAHISLYHSHSLSTTQHQSPKPRSSILKWFSSLTIHQRQAHLTVIDHVFVQIIIQMLCKLRANGGHGSFIILPDVQTRDLPTVCFKKSRGLLSRVAQSNQAENFIFQSTRLFCSKEGEKVEECSCSVKKLDALNVTEEFVENVDRFVEAMDNVSNGEFLRGEESELSSEWVEFGWLKAKGYYNLEAFVANGIELALRLAWLNCNSDKRRGVKLKDKLSGAGVAANVYWRKKGCVDWWRNLGDLTRKKVLTTIMGKAAKSLTHEILKEVSGASKDEIWLFSSGLRQLLRHDLIAQRKVQIHTDDIASGTIATPVSLSKKPTFLDNVFNYLYVLHDIITMSPLCISDKYDIENLFFSTLSSVCTISDCVLRKLRGFLMVMSLDYTKIELLEEQNEKCMPNKPKEKLGSSSRKKKGRTRNNKRPNSDSKPSLGMTLNKRCLKDLDSSKGKSSMEDFMTVLAPEDRDTCSGSSSPKMEMVHMEGLDVGKVQTMSRRSKKGKTHTKKSVGIRVECSEMSTTNVLSTCINVEEKLEKSDRISDNSTNIKRKNPFVSNIIASKSSNCSFLDTGNGICTQGKQENDLEASSEIESFRPSSGINGACNLFPSNTDVDCDSDIKARTVEHSDSVGNKDIIEENTMCSIDSEGKSTYLDKPVGIKVKEHNLMYQTLKSKQIYDSSISRRCSLYELPGVPSVYLPSINSHLPPATDRLHLDVGHNWHNRFCHSFVPTLQQTSNSLVEGGCNQIFSRPLPMSLDWPPTIRGGVYPSVACSYDSGFISRRQSTFSKCLAAQNMKLNPKHHDDEAKCPADAMDVVDLPNGLELGDECDSHWVSEEEFELHAVSGVDYSQYFGGGIMYWNSSDYPISGFSRPPSLSSDDSTWAWREADLNRAVDDMVAFSSSYSTTGLTSPTAASFCTPFEALGPAHQAVGYVMSGNDGKVLRSSSPVTDTAGEEDLPGSLVNGLSGEGEGKSGDSHPYPILRPIIIPNLSRERSRPDFKLVHDHKSPCLPPTRREQPRIKRPPSPVVLCVPRAPRPPPPSPVSGSRKQRGFPTVRSGSSSPRHWGMRGWYHDGSNSEEGYWRMDGAEVIWPSWRSKNLAANSMIQPLSAALLQDRLLAISQLGRDQEHPDVAIPLQPPELQNARCESLSLMHNLLHEEIESFYKKVAAENMSRKPFINWAVKRVTRSLQVLWPRSRTNVFGSNATGLSLPSSDVDLVVCLPPVRNLEPIKEAGILEGRNGIKETCLQHAARYLANQDWVKNDSLKTVENTAIPIIMLVVEVPCDVIACSTSNVQSPKEKTNIAPGEHQNVVHPDMLHLEDAALQERSQITFDAKKDTKSVRLDISFKSPSHTGLQTTELVKELTEQFPAATPLAMVLKKFLSDRSLDQSYSGGLSSYSLVLLTIRFLQHEHHLARSINQNFGSLLMDFLHFFGNVFDPRQMRVSVHGSGLYLKRERGCSIDPLHIDDPLYPTNNVGRNCFRIHQCIKAFSEAYSILENEISLLNCDNESASRPPCRLLHKIIPSIDML